MVKPIIYVRGHKIDQEKLRKFLKDIDFENIDQFQTDEGFWKSPITGDLFETKWQLYGQLGSFLRKVEKKDPQEPTRAGYVRALRAGVQPTAAQKEAHAEYNRAYRKRRRRRILEAKGIDPDSVLDDQDPVIIEERKVPMFSWD